MRELCNTTARSLDYTVGVGATSVALNREAKASPTQGEHP